MILNISQPGGIAPKILPELLPANQAQIAKNVVLWSGGCAAMSEPVTVTTPTKAGSKKTIYKFGNQATDDLYWFTWTTPVHVARGPIAGDTEQTTYFTGEGLPKKTRFALATGSGTSYPVVAYNLKVPAPASAPVLSQVGGTGPAVAEQRAYVYTNVTAWGEESAPSPAAVGTASSGLVLSLGSFDAFPSGQYDWASRYIYRSVTTSAGTNYYFVGSIASGTTTFLDNVDIAAVGDALVTLDWDAPPDDLHGIIALPSGALCGLSGKNICFSVIGAPYAWPQRYRKTVDYDPVAVATMGQGIVVLTNGFPYLINSGDPESASIIKLDSEQACVSARSVVSFEGGVAYASPDGMVVVSQSGTTVPTTALFSRADWQALSPATMFADLYERQYYGFFDGGGGFIFDPAASTFTPHDISATACYSDPVTDTLYIAAGTAIKKWDAGAARAYTWRSKIVQSMKPTTPAWARVRAKSYANLTCKLYADGALKLTQTVSSDKPFRLPGGYMASRFEVELSGTDTWYGVAVAHSIEELKNV